MEVFTELVEVPGTGMEVLQSSRKFRVRYGSLTELVEVAVRYGSLTELVEVPGTGMEVLQNSQKFRVRHGSLT